MPDTKLKPTTLQYRATTTKRGYRRLEHAYQGRIH